METQNISQTRKKKFSSLGLYMSLIGAMAVHSSGPVVYALSHKLAGAGSISVPIFFIFRHLSCSENWFSMHKQSLLEEDKCTQASHLHLTVCWVGVQHTVSQAVHGS